jgi:hypothetical protein
MNLLNKFDNPDSSTYFVVTEQNNISIKIGMVMITGTQMQIIVGGLLVLLFICFDPVTATSHDLRFIQEIQWLPTIGLIFTDVTLTLLLTYMFRKKR